MSTKMEPAHFLCGIGDKEIKIDWRYTLYCLLKISDNYII